MAAQIKAKQVQGLQSTLDALTGIDKVSETFTTTATSGDTGILISQSARETDGIQVFINGQKVQEGYSWKKGGAIVSADSLESNTELVWDSSTAGFDLEATDEVQIEYETLTSGNTLQGNSGISGTITGNLIPDTNEAYDLGSTNFKFKDIYMSGNTLYMGGQPLSIVNGQLTLNGNAVSGPIKTEHIHTATMDALLNIRPPYDENGTREDDYLRLKSGWETLNIGDHILRPSFSDPAAAAANGDWNKSLLNLMSEFQPSLEGTNQNINYDSNFIDPISWDSPEYKVGSLNIMTGYNSGSMYDLSETLDVHFVVMLIGIKNNDPAWPAGPSDLPTIYQQGQGNEPDHYIPQGQELVLLDRVTVNTTVTIDNAFKAYSDFQGQGLSNIDLSNYLSIGAVWRNLPDSNHGNSIKVNWHYLRS